MESRTVRADLEEIDAVQEGDPFSVSRPGGPDITGLGAGDDGSSSTIGEEQPDSAAADRVVEGDTAIDPIHSRGLIVADCAGESDLGGAIPVDIEKVAAKIVNQPCRVRSPAVADDVIRVIDQQILLAGQ